MRNYLREWRKARKLTQEELARKLGTTRQTIHATEQGKTVPSGILLLKIANFFDVDIRKIFIIEDEE